MNKRWDYQEEMEAGQVMNEYRFHQPALTDEEYEAFRSLRATLQTPDVEAARQTAMEVVVQWHREQGRVIRSDELQRIRILVERVEKMRLF